MAKKHWLMKTEPEVFSILDLQRDQVSWWEGVRNYQARNFMMKEMQVGDAVLFYHSSTEPTGVAGLAEISILAEPDRSQFDKKSEYFDKKATKDKPIWYCVQIKFVSKFKNFVSLQEIRANPALVEMPLLQRGQRLSIQPVSESQFKLISRLGQGK